MSQVRKNSEGGREVIQLPAQQIIKVFFPSDASAAVRTAKETALTIGFDQKDSEEIAIAVGELATNLVKHAKGGKLTLTVLTNGCKGIQIVSHDRGPGIADLEKAIVDGFSTKGSLGSGLGAVNRLMHEFDIISRVGVGTHIVCRRWVREVAWDVCEELEKTLELIYYHLRKHRITVVREIQCRHLN